MRHIVLLLALLLGALPARAAITCTTPFATAWAAAYSPTTPGNTVTQSSFTLTCQRNLGGDPATLNFKAAANNGANAQGGNNRAAFGANTIAYENYRDSGCANIWKAVGGNRITGSMNLSGFTPTSLVINFWGCIPTGQAGKPAGTYTDLVTVAVTNDAGGGVIATGTISISIATPAICTITTAPGTVAFTYTAFQPGAAPATTSFGVTCTNALPYTMSLDATVGVVSGLQYSLALSAPGSTGTGLEQTHGINGTMPAGQAGTCGATSCGGVALRTLTISY